MACLTPGEATVPRPSTSKELAVNSSTAYSSTATRSTADGIGATIALVLLIIGGLN